MPTINQLVKNIRKRKNHYNITKLLCKRPHLKAICVKIYTTKPKKPHSAIRKVAKVKLSTGRRIIAYVPGQGHNLMEHSVVLIRGGRVRDLPGIHYKIVRGVYDFTGLEKFVRRTRRSKFGVKKQSESLLLG